MRFVIHQEALNGNDEVLALIDRLIDRVADEIHKIEVMDADMVKSSACIPVPGRRERKF